MPYIGKSPTAVPLSASDLNDDIISLAKMAAGTDGNLITYDASGNPVAVATGDDGQILTSAGAGQPCAFEAAAGGGKIGQVRSTTKSDTWSESVGSGSFSSIVTGLTVAITPSDTSSKILILLNATIGVSSGQAMGFGLFRDSTQIDIADAAGSRSRMSKGKQDMGGSTSSVCTLHTNYLDSPSSDSELVYGIKTACHSSLTKTHYVNRSNDDADNGWNSGRAASTITAMEVLA